MELFKIQGSRKNNAGYKITEDIGSTVVKMAINTNMMNAMILPLTACCLHDNQTPHYIL